MATEKKDRPWDGRSRPSDDKYRKNFDLIFKKQKTIDKEKEKKENFEDEEYLREIKDKL